MEAATERAVKVAAQHPAGTLGMTRPAHQRAGGDDQLTARDGHLLRFANRTPGSYRSRCRKDDEGERELGKRHPYAGSQQVRQRLLPGADVRSRLRSFLPEQDADTGVAVRGEQRRRQRTIVRVTQEAVGEQLVVAELHDQTVAVLAYDCEGAAGIGETRARTVGNSKTGAVGDKHAAQLRECRHVAVVEWHVQLRQRIVADERRNIALDSARHSQFVEQLAVGISHDQHPARFDKPQEIVRLRITESILQHQYSSDRARLGCGTGDVNSCTLLLQQQHKPPRSKRVFTARVERFRLRPSPHKQQQDDRHCDDEQR